MNTRFAPAADGLAAWIAPSRTALLVIDMQVDFALAEGVLGGFGVDLSSVGPALEAAQTLVDAARKAGVAVVFIGLQTSPEQDSVAWNERMRRQGGDPEQDSALCRIGTPGAAFVGPQPAPGELVIAKMRYSGFFRTDLDAELRARGLDTLVACGLTTECCVDCTVRDAFHLDYHVFIARDASAAYESDLHEGALKSLELNCAILVDTSQVVAAWAGAA
jgi:ureidoacrylate peracid hydrolase